MMILWNALALAIRQIARNTLRSFLTTLGITIGVAAVIAMVSLGQSATASVQRDLSSLGQNLVFIGPGPDPRGNPQARSSATIRPFKLADVKAIQAEVAELDAVAPILTSSCVSVYGNVNHRSQVIGTDNEFLVARRWDVALGDPFSAGDDLAGGAVAVVGQTVRDTLFGTQSPIGATIRVDGVPVRVVGVLATKGQSTMGQDQDDIVVVPLRLMQRRIVGRDDVALIYVSVTSESAIDRVKDAITDVMNTRRHTRIEAEPDFFLRDMREVAATVGSVTAVLTSLLAAIAAVSLIVGGIGIMNIMLVSVTERTREIGTRLAIGARSRDVLLQFLIEAIVLAVIGGIFGILLGLGGSFAATVAFKLPFVVDPSIVVLAVAFSGVVGVSFGYFPARRAAHLNPIDALRHE